MQMKIATGLAVALTMLLTTVAVGATRSSGLDGVYRVVWTEKELATAGTSQRYAHENHGVLTWTLRDGHFGLNFSTPPLCHGTYAVSRTTMSIKEGPGCHGLVKGSWSLRNRDLRLRVTQATDPGDAVLFGGKPWKKIG